MIHGARAALPHVAERNTPTRQKPDHLEMPRCGDILASQVTIFQLINSQMPANCCQGSASRLMARQANCFALLRESPFIIESISRKPYDWRVADARTGKNGHHALVGMLLQAVFGRLAGYEDVNDAGRLRHDPAIRWIVGGKAASGVAASASQMGRFETRWLGAEKNLSALADLSGQWIDRVHARRQPKGVEENSPPFGARPGDGALRDASARSDNVSGLPKCVKRDNLSLCAASHLVHAV